VSTLERLEEARRQAPAVAGALVGIVVDNPAQCALIASGSYVVTRGLGRLVRPSTFTGVLMTATASYALCWWLTAEARRRGLLTFRVRDPATGELVTLAELGLESCGCGRCGADPPG
jgi:hypothetical protein